MARRKNKPTTPKQAREANEFSQTDTDDDDDDYRRQLVDHFHRKILKVRFGRISTSKPFVYGEYADQLEFIPAPRARFLAHVWRALFNSATWGDLKRSAPPEAYREIRRYNSDRDPNELRPDAPFGYNEMTAVPDGDYPDFVARSMFWWLPRDVQLAFGTIEDTTLNGEYLRLDPRDTKAIIQGLRKAGFQCRRNQRLIEQVHGEI